MKILITMVVVIEIIVLLGSVCPMLANKGNFITKACVALLVILALGISGGLIALAATKKGESMNTQPVLIRDIQIGY
ncbi:MAG: hypothetical protein M0Z61_06955 [Nitrospiraceae bacterium]|nr:hypothetical protein [Nitrospiraceae bacterium]